MSNSDLWVHRPDDGGWPRNFGRYEILCRLGAGGMAEVFLARVQQAGPSDGTAEYRLVALKKVLPHLATDTLFVSHFKREAAIAVRLEHPNIARVLDAGRIGASWFMAMELVRGETLARVLERGRQLRRPMSAELVRRVGAAVALGLHYAHELVGSDGTPQKIIHRDVTPQNVMLGYDGSVKLIDFGVASSVESTTRAGSLAGKVRYFSPEQIRRSRVDRRTDVYSLAVTLYEALLGAPAFDGENELAIMTEILEDEPPPIAGAPPKIIGALRRAMAKDPDHRFPSAEELAKALLPDGIEERAIACPPDPSLARYVQDVMPEGAHRWSTMVERASTGLFFELETSVEADRWSLLGETVPISLPDAPASPPSATDGLRGWPSSPGPVMGGAAAALVLPAITSPISARAISVFSALVALVMISFGVATGEAPRATPLARPSWAQTEPVADSGPIADTLLTGPGPTASAPLFCPALGPTAAIGGTGRQHGEHRGEIHPNRTRHWKRQRGAARQGVLQGAVRASIGSRSRRALGSIADQLEPSPYIRPPL